ncbi:unnamed protein product [Umbelopsis ramanniana]
MSNSTTDRYSCSYNNSSNHNDCQAGDPKYNARSLQSQTNLGSHLELRRRCYTALWTTKIEPNSSSENVLHDIIPVMFKEHATIQLCQAVKWDDILKNSSLALQFCDNPACHPHRKAEANANDNTDLRFEQLVYQLQERDGVELSAKTNLKKAFKALAKEKKEDQARKDQEKAANSVGDGDEDSGDEESRKFLEELRNEERLKKRRKVQDKDNVTVVVDNDAMDDTLYLQHRASSGN